MNLLKAFSFFALLMILSLGCRKDDDRGILTLPVEKIEDGYTQYLIKKGAHFAELSTFQPIETGELKFMVTFDSSAVYRSHQHMNQPDVNKLYGFSDNNTNHHLYSARFGWNWMNDALHIYAYVYNNGERIITDLGTINIGEETSCSIRVGTNKYTFTLNENSTNVERYSITANAKGYLLFPYFGGDEAAPHDVSIRIKNL